MIKRQTRRMPFKRFCQDDDGSLTLEFVLWIPFLTFWAVFTLAVFHAMDNRADAAKATYTIADIISRDDVIEGNDLRDLNLLVNQLLPGAAAGATMRVSSIEFKDDQLAVLWTECFGDIPALTDAAIPVEVIPTMEEKETIILTETYVPYLPIFDVMGLEPFVWTHVIANRPRFFGKIEYPDADACGAGTGGGTGGSEDGPPIGQSG